MMGMYRVSYVTVKVHTRAQVRQATPADRMRALRRRSQREWWPPYWVVLGPVAHHLADMRHGSVVGSHGQRHGQRCVHGVLEGLASSGG